MSFEDDNKPGRGAYTPPTDDDLPFRRNSYDPRSGRNVGSGGGKAPPVTLIISAVVLLLLIVAVIFFYRSGMRASTGSIQLAGGANAAHLTASFSVISSGSGLPKSRSSGWNG